MKKNSCSYFPMKYHFC